VIVCRLAEAREVEVREETLPPGVRQALESRYPSARLLSLTRERVRGIDTYEAEMSVAGRHMAISLGPNGELREQETEISVSDLPAGVRTSLARSAQAKWKIERVERVTRAVPSEAPRYELTMVYHQRRFELVYAPDGQRLSTGLLY
jgi:hypothetical protein